MKKNIVDHEKKVDLAINWAQNRLKSREDGLNEEQLVFVKFALKNRLFCECNDLKK